MQLHYRRIGKNTRMAKAIQPQEKFCKLNTYNRHRNLILLVLNTAIGFIRVHIEIT